MSRLISFTFFIISILLLSSCGPHYKTDYTYIPPDSDIAKKCVARCQIQKQKCVASERREYEQCVERYKDKYDACKEREEQKYAACRDKEIMRETICKANSNNHLCNNSFSYCSDNSASCSDQSFYKCTKQDNCNKDYRECFALCGGNIQEHTYEVDWLGNKV